jgi:hypothetical protein
MSLRQVKDRNASRSLRLRQSLVSLIPFLNRQVKDQNVKRSLRLKELFVSLIPFLKRHQDACHSHGRRPYNEWMLFLGSTYGLLKRILAESGLRMEQFPSSKHFTDVRLGSAKANNESAGKRKSGKTGHPAIRRCVLC